MQGTRETLNTLVVQWYTGCGRLGSEQSHLKGPAMIATENSLFQSLAEA